MFYTVPANMPHNEELAVLQEKWKADNRKFLLFWMLISLIALVITGAGFREAFLVFAYASFCWTFHC